MESCKLSVSCKVSKARRALGFTFTLQANRSIHDSMNALLIFTFYYKHLKYKKNIFDLGKNQF